MGKVRKIITFAVAVVVIILSAIWWSGVVAGRGGLVVRDPIADLERRISALENAPLFRVVNKQGKTVFAVYSQLPRAKGKVPGNVAIVYNAQGHAVATLRAYDDGGSFQAFSDPGNFSTLVESSTGLSTGFRFIERSPPDPEGLIQEVDRISLGEAGDTGEGSAKNYSLKIFTKSDGVIAGIGESKAGSGALIIGDANGNKRDAMLIDANGKGIFGLFNPDNKAILTFGEAPGNTGGSLAIGDASSGPMVKMGTNGNRYGIVLAFPVGIPYVPRSGLPGSYFLGCITASKTCVLP